MKPAQAMKKLVWSEATVQGPRRLSMQLPQPPSNNGPIIGQPIVAGHARQVNAHRARRHLVKRSERLFGHLERPFGFVEGAVWAQTHPDGEQLAEVGEQLELLLAEARAHLAGKAKLAGLVVAEEQRPDLAAAAALASKPPTDHELLALLGLDLDPVGRALARFVGAVEALGAATPAYTRMHAEKLRESVVGGGGD